MHEIAKMAHMSFKDIGNFIHEQEKEQEVKKVQAQQQVLIIPSLQTFFER